MAEYPLYEMSSFSRSGETLMLRCLQAHPDIEVISQIREPDEERDVDLFWSVINKGKMAIDAADPLTAHRLPHAGTRFVVKNFAWTTPGKRQGFVLIRNPFSVVVSAHRHTEDPKKEAKQRAQQIRWCRNIDKLMVPFIESIDNLTAYLALYNRKMLHDRRSGMPFVRYEDFVSDPEIWLRKIVAHLGLEWSPRVLESHLDYKEGETGHGGIKLWQPINMGSMDKYKALEPELASKVYSLTQDVLRVYGYRWNGDEIKMLDAKGML